MNATRAPTAVRVGSGCAAPTTVLLVRELHTKKQGIYRHVGEPNLALEDLIGAQAAAEQPHSLG